MAKFRQTKKERYTQELEERALQTLRRDWPDICFNDTYEIPDIEWMAKIDPFELLKACPRRKDKESSAGEEIFLVWDGKEFTTFDLVDDAIVFFSATIRETAIKQRLTFLASPLIISGFLAFGLLALLATISLRGDAVPSQLWSIFTAVVAFYFGREGWTSMRREVDHDG